MAVALNLHPQDIASPGRQREQTCQDWFASVPGATCTGLGDFNAYRGVGVLFLHVYVQCAPALQAKQAFPGTVKGRPGTVKEGVEP